VSKFEVASVLSAEARFVARQLDAVNKVESRVSTLLQRRMPPEAKRDIGAELNLKAARIAAGISTRKTATGVELIGSYRQIGLTSFGAKWPGPKSAGVKVEIIRGNKKTIPGAFIRSPGGRAAATGPQVFRRVRVGSKSAPRYPIERLPSTTIAQSLKKPARVERLDAYADRIAAAEADRILKTK
jgi:hypothetical protein